MNIALIQEIDMLTTIKNAALSATIAVTALTAIPAAHADNLYLGLENGQVGVGIGDDEYRRRDHRDRREGDYRDYNDSRDSRDYRDYRDNRDNRRGDFGPRCSPGRALDKADRIGIHDPSIRFVGERAIGVVGHRHGRTVRVTFGRAPSCPIVG